MIWLQQSIRRATSYGEQIDWHWKDYDIEINIDKSQVKISLLTAM